MRTSPSLPGLLLGVLALIVPLSMALSARAEVAVQEIRTPAGHEVWLSQDDQLPFVALEIRFRGGTALDLPEALGAVTLMTGLLEEGAGDMDAQGFADARDDLAATIRFSAHEDDLSVSARFLSDTTAEVAGLLHLALTDPRFDPVALDRVREQVLAGLRSDAEDPGTIAAETFAQQVYGDHPYARPGNGTLDSVAALTREDIQSAFRGAIAADRVHIAAAGAISGPDLAALIDIILDGIPATGRPLSGRVTPVFDGGITVVPFETPQSVIQFGQPGINREDPDYFVAFVLNQILGGSGFESRLTREVRVNRGLTYGIGAYLIGKDLADLYVGGTSTVNARVAETLAVVRDVWVQLAEEGPTEAELAQAKTYLTGAYPLRFDGNVAIANILAGMQMIGLGADYIATRNARIEAVTLVDVKRVAADMLRPDALTFVVVGQPDGVGDQDGSP
ncbi:MAG: M16 family metallopeptidase [Qingshengfaniella sp.]